MNTDQNKKIAIAFQTLLLEGKIDEAYDTYVDMAGKHHNAYFAKGFETLKQAMLHSETEFPNKHGSVKSVVAENDTVAIHSHIILKPNELEVSAVHIYKFKNEKIFELWDVGQVIPQQCPNADGVF